MFGWFKKKPVVELVVGRYYAFNDCPFIDAVVIAYVEKVKEGWVRYFFWKTEHGVMRGVGCGETKTVDRFNLIFKCDVTDKVKEYEASK
jgi:hypothetical protein